MHGTFTKIETNQKKEQTDDALHIKLLFLQDSLSMSRLQNLSFVGPNLIVWLRVTVVMMHVFQP